VREADRRGAEFQGVAGLAAIAPGGEEGGEIAGGRRAKPGHRFCRTRHTRRVPPSGRPRVCCPPSPGCDRPVRRHGRPAGCHRCLALPLPRRRRTSCSRRPAGRPPGPPGGARRRWRRCVILRWPRGSWQAEGCVRRGVRGGVRDAPGRVVGQGRHRPCRRQGRRPGAAGARMLSISPGRFSPPLWRFSEGCGRPGRV
jgi:hypothetical protein